MSPGRPSSEPAAFCGAVGLLGTTLSWVMTAPLLTFCTMNHHLGCGYIAGAGPEDPGAPATAYSWQDPHAAARRPHPAGRPPVPAPS